MSMRTLTVSPSSLLDLLKAISQGREVAYEGEPIPPEASIGAPRFDEASRTFKVDIVARFPDRATGDLPFKYAVRRGEQFGASVSLTENG